MVTSLEMSTNCMASMTSREISELVEARHDNVMQSIERLVERGVIPPRSPETYYWTNFLGFQVPSKQYVFRGVQGRRDSYIVVAQISPQYIGLVIDAWGRTASSLEDLLSALEAFDVPEELGDMFVYAIKEDETGRIKLGISRDPEARVRQLQTGNSQRLHLVGYCLAKDRFKGEAALHERAAQYRIRGEWFSAEAQALLA